MKLSIVIPFYLNSRMLARQLIVWRDEWPASVKADIEIVLIDDASPDPAANVIAEMWGGDRAGLPSLSIYRVKIDRPWGQHPARNLGAHVAEGHWLLMTDMDRIIPADTLTEVLRMIPSLGANDVVTFGNVDAPTTLTWRADHWPEMERTRRPTGQLKWHVNSFCVSRKRYWKMQGYDERFRGYGTDSHFRRKLFGPDSKTHHLHHAPLIRVSRETIADASTTTFGRGAEFRVDKKPVLAQMAREGRAYRPLTLAFEWERVL